VWALGFDVQTSDLVDDRAVLSVKIMRTIFQDQNGGEVDRVENEIAWATSWKR
jgi:hypothetical protein